jgi:hypothetical protein
MAVLLLVQRLAKHGQDGSGSSAGLFIGQPGALAHLPDEVVEPDRVCLLLATPPCLQLLCEAGEICGKAPRLAIAQLVREPLQYRPADIRRFLTRQPGSLRYRTDECLVVHGYGSLRRLTGQYRGQLDLASRPGPDGWPPARMAGVLRLLVIWWILELLPPRPAAFAAQPGPGLRRGLVLPPGSVYSDRWARSCVMPSICPAASLSNW